MHTEWQPIDNSCDIKMISIRPAKSGDIPQLVALLEALFALEADFHFNRDKQTQGLQLLLENDNACIIVAESNDDNKLLGMCSVQTHISTAEGGPVGLVEDVIVKAGFRNRGIGKKLLSAAVYWARQQGLKRLQLLADKNNLLALKFYGKQNWQSTQLVCLQQPLNE